MKIVSTIARILLGALFVFTGANLLHPFLKMTMPTGAAGQLMTGLFATHLLILIGACELIGGLLLLVGRFVTLGLVILGPVIVCIDFFHLSVAHQGIPLASLVTLLWILVALGHRRRLGGIFAAAA